MNILNDLIYYNIGKTSLNYYLNQNIVNKIKNNSNYEQNYNYIKTCFVDALEKSINIVVENENINKISVNDTLIENYMSLFDELGFVIKVLSEEELSFLFPNKESKEKDKLKYYAYLTKNNYLGIFN